MDMARYDETYCAEIIYSYAKTSTRSTYRLEVDIDDNKLRNTLAEWRLAG
jgi:hypothetical protein